MKFLAWLCAILVFFASLCLALIFNLHRLILTPQATKEALVQIDFYNQMKTTLKKDLFETSGLNTQSVDAVSAASAATLENYNFQPKIEKLITDFYQGLSDPSHFILTIDLSDIKSLFATELRNNGDTVDLSSLSAIPDQWKIDLSHYSIGTGSLAFIYRNYIYILIGYGILVALFLALCLSISFKYLKLFFSVFLIVGILLFAERFLWTLINPETIFANILGQGRSSLDILVSNLVSYFKDGSTRLLLWESLLLALPSLVGIIVVSAIPDKTGKIPLANTKN